MGESCFAITQSCWDCVDGFSQGRGVILIVFLPLFTPVVGDGTSLGIRLVLLPYLDECAQVAVRY